MHRRSIAHCNSVMCSLNVSFHPSYYIVVSSSLAANELLLISAKHDKASLDPRDICSRHASTYPFFHNHRTFHKARLAFSISYSKKDIEDAHGDRYIGADGIG
jgi:hypothetical protein